eukprot:138964-Pyramimonas_sp.AAC.1
MDALGWIGDGQALFDCSSITIQAFLPKLVTDAELRDGECTRSPDKVRVLGLRNTDVKLLSSVMNRALQPLIHHIVPPCQRGFVGGRNFGVNILELDAHARELSVGPPGSSDIPLLFSLDFGQAFPSLNQEFMACVLQ